MPKVQKGVSYKKTYSEEDVQKAADAVRKGKSFHAASNLYNIPRSTLRFRMSDKFTKINPGPPPVLGYNREKELVNWSIECSRKGFPRRKENLQASIKNFLDQEKIQTPFKDNIPGDGWYKSFLKRNSILTERFPEGVTYASACVSESDIRNWFKEIHDYLSQEKYLHILKDPTRLYNTDETYFMVCPKMKYVLAPRGTHNVYEIEKGNAKLNLTVLFTFSASGVVTPPTVVYPYTRVPAVVAQSVPSHWGIGATPSGWMNSDIFCKYLKNIFYPYLKNEKITFPVILFLDGHSSHLTMEVSQLCSELEIIVICLYPNSTRLLQPADVSAFKPLKSLWKKCVLEWRQKNLTLNLTLDKMAPILENAVNKFSSNSVTVKNGFKACGLYPWNPNAVDYSKCLGVSKAQNEETFNSNSVDKKSISFEELKNVVGNDLMDEIQSFSIQKNLIGEKSAEFLALYKLFEELGKQESSHQDQQPIFSETEIDSSQNSSMGEKQQPISPEIEIVASQDYSKYQEAEIQVLSETSFLNHSIAESQNLEDIPIIIVNSVQQDNFNDRVSEINYLFEQDIVADTEEMRTRNCNVHQVNDDMIVVDETEEIVDEPKEIVDGTEEMFNETEEMFNVDDNNSEIMDQTNAFQYQIDSDEAIDLSLSHRRDCPKKIHNFLDSPPTPKRKGKKFTERRSYAITSLQWKLNEAKKLEQQKLEQKRKELKKLEVAEKKKVLEKEKELKKVNRLKKKEEVHQKQILRSIKKEKADDQSIKKKRGRKPKNEKCLKGKH